MNQILEVAFHKLLTIFAHASWQNRSEGMSLGQVCGPFCSDTHFEFSTRSFYGTQVNALWWPHQNFYFVVFKPFCYSFEEMLRIVVLLGQLGGCSSDLKPDSISSALKFLSKSLNICFDWPEKTLPKCLKLKTDFWCWSWSRGLFLAWQFSGLWDVKLMYMVDGHTVTVPDASNSFINSFVDIFG